MKSQRLRKATGEVLTTLVCRPTESDLQKLKDIAMLRGISVSRAAEQCIGVAFASLTAEELAAIVVIKRFRTPQATA